MKLRKSSYARLQMQAALKNQQIQQQNHFQNSNYLVSSGQRDNFSSKWTNKAGTAMAARLMRPSGKGRFGKRPPSFSMDFRHYGSHHSNDNSNDSGLECDNSNTDSQFWGSSEDLSNSSTSSTPSPPRIFQFTQISQNTPSTQNFSMMASEIERFRKDINNNSNDLNKKLSVEESLSGPGKNIEPSTTLPEAPDLKPIVPESRTVSPPNGKGRIVRPGKILRNVHLQRSINSSPIAIKKSRFNFQPPPVPKSKTGNRVIGKKLPPGIPPTLSSILSNVSSDGRVQLQIIAQPEEQHRARYQTEGSRGAIKDRKGNGFPGVKLIGYDKSATLQIFIGTDGGKVSPHMFYQACKVTGKSSTPCTETKLEGTVLIEIEFQESKEMIISCDCVGILKERNVDVEQRFPFYSAASARKKSTKCRLIFRTTIINSDGIQETLQVSSLPILCTQPPGQPEICKQSLRETKCCGGEELFIIGKNFLKDTKVIVQEETVTGELLWEAKGEILKEYLQQNHLICVLPPYKDESITKPVDCKVSVWSGGKLSEPHHITYLPNSPSNGSLANIEMPLSQPTTIVEQLNLTVGAGTPLLESSFSQPECLVPSLSSPIIEQNLSYGTEMQSESKVVSELQEILDQTGTIVKPNISLEPPPSFISLNYQAPIQFPPVSENPHMQFQANSTESSMQFPNITENFTNISSNAQLNFGSISETSMQFTNVPQPTQIQTMQFTNVTESSNMQSEPILQFTSNENNQTPFESRNVSENSMQFNNITENSRMQYESQNINNPSLNFTNIAENSQMQFQQSGVDTSIQFPKFEAPSNSDSTMEYTNVSENRAMQFQQGVTENSMQYSTISENSQMQFKNPNVTESSQMQFESPNVSESSLRFSTVSENSQMQFKNPNANESSQMQFENPNGSETSLRFPNVAENSQMQFENSNVAVTTISTDGGRIFSSLTQIPPVSQFSSLIAPISVCAMDALNVLKNEGGAMSLMGTELQGDQGTIANALTQLSDNELLNYINPSCFEQATF